MGARLLSNTIVFSVCSLCCGNCFVSVHLVSWGIFIFFIRHATLLIYQANTHLFFWLLKTLESMTLKVWTYWWFEIIWSRSTGTHNNVVECCCSEKHRYYQVNVSLCLMASWPTVVFLFPQNALINCIPIGLTILTISLLKKRITQWMVLIEC